LIFIIYMTNPIKYSTGTETLALKKGNFYIGTGDVGKGPTSSTGYYNGISPPSGGYTIYLNKETGGPSIYTAANDAQLISLTNSIAGQSYTTANECLVYFAGQTDKMVLNRNYEGIVTDGLVLNVDAGFTPSYPKNGNTWYDVSVNTNNGTLTNGPTYSSNDGGGIVFDGSNDYVNLFALDSTVSFTIDFWFKTSASGIKVITGMYNGSGADWWIGIDSVNNLRFSFGSPSKKDIQSLNTVNDGNLRHAVCVYDKSINSTFLYINSVLQSSTNLIPSTVTQPGGNLTIGRFGDITFFYWPGNVYNYKIYNRTLSATEVLQNYNAQKGRFGL
jgi:hypothetical protein